MAARLVRTALVTGGAGAFGSGVLAALRSRGVQAVGLDHVPTDGLLTCDVTDPAAVKAAVATAVEQLGGLDAVVHCAGVGPAVDIGSDPGSDVRDALEVNLLGTWRVTSAALPALAAGPGRGRVVLVSSLLGHVTVPFAGAYCVSKRGVLAYGDALRIEYGGRVVVTTVLPGYVDTPIHARSRAAGVALDGLVPSESIDDVVGTVMRVLAASKPPRETATSLSGQVVRLVARHFPGAVDAVVLGRARKHVLSGGFTGSALGDAWRERLTADREEVRP
jgi:NAD(P)-dependent dehydrogenase (short-subunit alcohol dehydrogenase family)